MQLSNLLQKNDERALLIGKTGSGKTTLAEYLCAWHPYVVVYDAKGLIDWKGYQVFTNMRELKKSDASKLIYQPPLGETLDKDAVENFLHWVYARENTFLYIDEVASICFDGHLPYWLHGILSRGRQLGIGLLAGTQRPKRIPLALFSESERFYVFRLRLREDAERVEQTLGIDAESVQALKNYHFYYGNNEAVHSKPLTLKLS